MTWLDYSVLGVIGLSLTSGLVKGLIRSILGLLAAITGLLCAALWYSRLTPIIQAQVETGTMARFIAFLLIFLGVVLMGMALGRVLRKGLEKVHLGWLDHLAGGAFGLLRGWLVCSVFYIALTAFPVQLDVVSQAKLSPTLLRGAELITAITSHNLKDHFQQGYQRLQLDWESFSSR